MTDPRTELARIVNAVPYYLPGARVQAEILAALLASPALRAALDAAQRLAGVERERATLAKALAFAEAPFDLTGFTPEQEKWVRGGLNSMVARLRAVLDVETLTSLVDDAPPPSAPAAEPTDADMLDTGWRKCDFCGCFTNAKVRACCNAGRDVDRGCGSPPATGAADAGTATKKLHKPGSSLRDWEVTDYLCKCDCCGEPFFGPKLSRACVVCHAREQCAAPTPGTPAGAAEPLRAAVLVSVSIGFTTVEPDRSKRTHYVCLRDANNEPLLTQTGFASAAEAESKAEAVIRAIAQPLSAAPSRAALAEEVRGLKRYDVGIWASRCFRRDHPLGEYVLWSDVEALAARLERNE